MPPSTQPVPSAKQKFEDEAAQWEATGKLGWSANNEYAFTKLLCWIDSAGAKAEGVSERLERYYSAAEAQMDRDGQKWYDEFLGRRDWCSICGETFRLENLSLCTHCDCLLGYCHQFSGGKAANGNPACPSCKSGEIIG